MHQIQHNIKWYRAHKKITQQDLADLLDTTLGRIKSYETGTAVPQIEMLIAIAQMLDITMDALVHVKLDEVMYRAAKKEKTKEHKFFDDLATINSRLDKVENALKRKLKQKS